MKHGFQENTFPKALYIKADTGSEAKSQDGPVSTQTGVTDPSAKLFASMVDTAEGTDMIDVTVADIFQRLGITGFGGKVLARVTLGYRAPTDGQADGAGGAASIPTPGTKTEQREPPAHGPPAAVGVKESAQAGCLYPIFLSPSLLS